MVFSDQYARIEEWITEQTLLADTFSLSCTGQCEIYINDPGIELSSSTSLPKKRKATKLVVLFAVCDSGLSVVLQKFWQNFRLALLCKLFAVNSRHSLTMASPMAGGISGTSACYLLTALLRTSVLFLAVGNCFGLPVTDRTDTPAPASNSEPFLIVKNRFPSLGYAAEKPFAKETSLESRLCGYAGPTPQTEDISNLATSWACESVEDGIITLPEYVYKMKPHDPDLWIRLSENCGCTMILYSIPYLWYEVSTNTWTYSTRKVPVGTSCPDYESELCKLVVRDY